jgi:selenide,water dikinase
MQPSSLTTDLVLIGGGHSHLAVIKHFATNPIAGLRITVISRDIHTPYSGMMPGMIAGHYQFDDIHIDLQRLCEWAGIRLFHSTVTNIDLEQQSISCDNQPDIHYDWLSINTGSQPDLSNIKGARVTGGDTVGIGVKPIDRFLAYLPIIEQQLEQKLEQATAQHTISVVGGGAASVEVVLALQYYFESQAIPSRQSSDPLQFELICGSDVLLPSHNSSVRKHFLTILKDRNIKLLTQSKVTHATTIQPKTTRAQAINPEILLTLAHGEQHKTDTVVWAINAGSAPWLKKTGLACNDQGFIRINPYLQSESHANIFAAGDIAHFSSHPLPKSGVYAVRAGPKLAKNLHRAILQQPLKAYQPQRHFLSLLMTGDQQAIASRGNFSMAGKLMWRWKDHIDRNFVELYSPKLTDKPAI